MNPTEPESLNENRSPCDAQFIRYLGLRLRHRTFKTIQTVSVLAALVGAVISFALWRDHPYWLARYAWIIFSAIAIGETGETLFVLRKMSEHREDDG